MATLPPGRLTFGQIRDLALRKAGNTSLLADAGDWLSQICFELYTQWDWPFLQTVATLTINTGTFTLPTDFLKAQDDNAFKINTYDGNPIGPSGFLSERDRYAFESARGSSAATGGMPQLWNADRNAGLGYVFPDPTGHMVIATLRYKALPVPDTTPPDPTNPLANDAVVPAFPWHSYLVQALFVMALEYESDGRADTEAAKRDEMLNRIRTAAMPLRSVEPIVPLDPEIFGRTFSGD